jgi:hypothetical protein
MAKESSGAVRHCDGGAADRACLLQLLLLLLLHEFFPLAFLALAFEFGFLPFGFRTALAFLACQYLI